MNSHFIAISRQIASFVSVLGSSNSNVAFVHCAVNMKVALVWETIAIGEGLTRLRILQASDGV